MAMTAAGATADRPVRPARRPRRRRRDQACGSRRVTAEGAADPRRRRARRARPGLGALRAHPARSAACSASGSAGTRCSCSATRPWRAAVGRPRVRDRVVAGRASPPPGCSRWPSSLGQVATPAGPRLARGRHLNFFTQSMAFAAPLSPAVDRRRRCTRSSARSSRSRLATLLVGAARASPRRIFLAEVGGPPARPVRTLVEAMTALPDIIAGLFILAFLILTLGLPKSGLAAALALAVTMMPIVTRASEAVLRMVPGTLREASYALGGQPVAHGADRRAAHRPVRPGHRRRARDGPRHRRDRTGAAGVRVPRSSTRTRSTAGRPACRCTSTTRYRGGPRRPRHPGLRRRLRADHPGLILFAIARRLGGGAPGELTRRQRRKIARQAARRRKDARMRRLRPSRPRPDRLDRRGAERGAGDSRRRRRPSGPAGRAPGRPGIASSAAAASLPSLGARPRQAPTPTPRRPQQPQPKPKPARAPPSPARTCGILYSPATAARRPRAR